MSQPHSLKQINLSQPIRLSSAKATLKARTSYVTTGTLGLGLRPRRRIRPEVANAETLMGNHSRKQKANSNSRRSKRSPGYRPPISVHLIAALPRAPSWHDRNLRKLPTGFLLHNESQQADTRKLNQPAIVMELAFSSEPVSIPEQHQPLDLIDVELICS